MMKGIKILLCEREFQFTYHRNTSSFYWLTGCACGKNTHLQYCWSISATLETWVPSMTLASIAAGADGIMLEVHPNPTKAAVDPLNQLVLAHSKIT